MPSGAKKRKAAKKKKEKEDNSNTLHEEDDSKVHEEKESESGETNSPLSCDNHTNMHFVEGENKKEEDESLTQSASTKSESIGVNGNGEISDKVVVEEKSCIEIDQEIKLKDVTIEHIEIEDVSSSSSSDEESKFVGKNVEVINLEKPVEYAPNLHIDLEKTSNSLEVTQVNEVVSHNLAVVSPNEESREVVSIVEDHDLAIAKSKVEISNLVSASIPKVEPVIMAKKEVRLDEDLGSKVNGKSEINIISTKGFEDGEVTKIATIVEDESKTQPQSSIQVVDKVNGVEDKKESEIESMDRKTRVALPPRPVQATSSMGCCGLFELITGSNR